MNSTVYYTLQNGLHRTEINFKQLALQHFLLFVLAYYTLNSMQIGLIDVFMYYATNN